MSIKKKLSCFVITYVQVTSQRFNSVSHKTFKVVLFDIDNYSKDYTVVFLLKSLSSGPN